MNEPLKITELTCTPEQAAARIAGNWNRVRESVSNAAIATGRSPEDVRIVGVTKYVDAAITRWLVDAGCHDLGENRPQTLMQKSEQFGKREFSEKRFSEAPIRWHQIGHLQRNKVRRLLDCNPLIHSVDSERLLDEIHTEARRLSRTIDVLMEINVSEEPAKTGLPPEEIGDIVRRHVLRFQSEPASAGGARILGLMAMAGWGTDAGQAQRQFARLREIRDALQNETDADLPELSMGMSGDYQAAITEGATMVRIGSSLFEGVLG